MILPYCVISGGTYLLCIHCHFLGLSLSMLMLDASSGVASSWSCMVWSFWSICVYTLVIVSVLSGRHTLIVSYTISSLPVSSDGGSVSRSDRGFDAVLAA